MRRQQSKVKNDNVELLSLLDKCSQILKDDRLLLRQQIKEGCSELLQVFQAHKKKQDLHLLQLELRKYLNKIKGKNQQTSFLTKTNVKENQPNPNQTSFLAHYQRIEHRQLPLEPKLELAKPQVQASVQKKPSQPSIRRHLSPQVRSPTHFKSKPKSQNTTAKKQKSSPNKLKQEFSPRFNTNQVENTQPLEGELSDFLNQREIENSRTQLEIFEQKINEYSKGGNTNTNTSTLWNNYSQSHSPISQICHQKNDTIFTQTAGDVVDVTEAVNFETFSQNRQDARFNCVLASFQNFNPQLNDYHNTTHLENLQSEGDLLVQEESTNKKVTPPLNHQDVQDWAENNDFDKNFEASQSVILHSNSKFADSMTYAQQYISKENYSPNISPKKFDFQNSHNVSHMTPLQVNNYHHSAQNSTQEQYQVNKYSPINKRYSPGRKRYSPIGKNSAAQFQKPNEQPQMYFKESSEMKFQSSPQRMRNPSPKYSPLRNTLEPRITEAEKEVVSMDDIMQKYAYLFTAPDFLQQCKNSIQSLNTHTEPNQETVTFSEIPRVSHPKQFSHIENHYYSEKFTQDIQPTPQYNQQQTLNFDNNLLRHQNDFNHSKQASISSKFDVEKHDGEKADNFTIKSLTGKVEQSIGGFDFKLHTRDSNTLYFDPLTRQEPSKFEPTSVNYEKQSLRFEQTSVQNFELPSQKFEITPQKYDTAQNQKYQSIKYDYSVKPTFDSFQQKQEQRFDSQRSQQTQYKQDTNILTNIEVKKYTFQDSKQESFKYQTDQKNHSSTKKFDSDSQQQDWNFMDPCYSVVCKGNMEWTKWQTQLKGIDSLSAETVFDEIFSENSLNRISRAFFRFKMENLLSQLQVDVQVDDLFNSIDTKQDGFVDVNEMGTFLTFICPIEKDNIYRQIFDTLETKKGYFTKGDLDNFLTMIQSQCDVAENLDLLELSNYLFGECDIFQSNSFTYWEFYLKKSTDSCSKTVQVLQEYLEQIQQLNQQ